MTLIVPVQLSVLEESAHASVNRALTAEYASAENAGLQAESARRDNACAADSGTMAMTEAANGKSRLITRPDCRIPSRIPRTLSLRAKGT